MNRKRTVGFTLEGVGGMGISRPGLDLGLGSSINLNERKTDGQMQIDRTAQRENIGQVIR